MPENWKSQSNAVSTSSNASGDNLEDAMWHLKIQGEDNQEGVGENASTYPDRPGEPDCIYFLRTGLCGYGDNCRFNHPAYVGQGGEYRGELPERVGQPECQYFLKTGTCKFGATCKFHHPKDRQIAGQVPLNILGLPMRQEEKSCPYYMRTWSCKFGAACKFHHPQPTGLPITGGPAYGSTGSSAPTGLSYVGGLQAWSLPRTPSLSGSTMQGPQAYMPVMLSSSQGLLPGQQRWNTYMGNAFGSNSIYNNKQLGESGSSGQMNYMSGLIQNYPERPGEPECQYYMKTGTCRFASQCKYHHPKERIAPLIASSIGPFGLPLRPGQDICTFYSMYGICKFGSACKFDHPLPGYYNYGVSMPAALSLSDSSLSLYPYPRNSSMSQLSETSASRSDMTKTEVTNAKHQNPETQILEDPPQDSTSPTHSATSERAHDD